MNDIFTNQTPAPEVSQTTPDFPTTETPDLATLIKEAEETPAQTAAEQTFNFSPTTESAPAEVPAITTERTEAPEGETVSPGANTAVALEPAPSAEPTPELAPHPEPGSQEITMAAQPSNSELISTEATSPEADATPGAEELETDPDAYLAEVNAALKNVQEVGARGQEVIEHLDSQIAAEDERHQATITDLNERRERIKNSLTEIERLSTERKAA